VNQNQKSQPKPKRIGPEDAKRVPIEAIARSICAARLARLYPKWTDKERAAAVDQQWQTCLPEAHAARNAIFPRVVKEPSDEAAVA
jgi:hypothetical protein